MPYTFDADPRSIVAERRSQFIALGTSAEVIDSVAAKVEDLWADGPGGWPFEWSLAAEEAEATGDLLGASLLYGIAKYPCLGNDAHAAAYAKQLDTYLRAAQSFPDVFERLILEVPYRGGWTKVAVHLLTPVGATADSPLVLMMGGVDTWKQDVHNSAAQLGRALQARMALIDMTGVGESRVPSAPDGNEVLAGVIEALRGTAKAGVFGFSFGGYWAVKLALIGAVDAAVAVGALVEGAWGPHFLPNMPNGMSGIMGNSQFRDDPFVDDEAFVSAMAPFALGGQGLLHDWGTNPVPMLVANGSDDPYVPPEDVTVFADRPATVVRLVAGATHCAPEAMPTLMPWMIGWLREQLS